MHSRTANENTMVPSDVDRLIDPKTIFRKALLHNANSIIVAHNHPSGNLRPSKEDLDIMERIREAGKIITIRLLDFIIFNEGEYYSCLDK